MATVKTLEMNFVRLPHDRVTLMQFKSDSIVKQTNKVYLLSYTTMNNKNIFYYIKILSLGKVRNIPSRTQSSSYKVTFRKGKTHYNHIR